jgi:hypothetical protein
MQRADEFGPFAFQYAAHDLSALSFPIASVMRCNKDAGK